MFSKHILTKCKFDNIFNLPIAVYATSSSIILYVKRVTNKKQGGYSIFYERIDCNQYNLSTNEYQQSGVTSLGRYGAI